MLTNSLLPALPELPSLFNGFFSDYDNYFDYKRRAYMKDDAVHVELPGIKKENVVLKDIDSETISIEWSQGDSKGKYKFTVPRHSDTSAEMTDGILKIKFKEDKEDVKLIKIK